MATGDQVPEQRGGTSGPFAVPTARDLTGKTLGDFQVERLLGQGGMGEVYLARQTSLDRPVALKVLRPEWANDPTYMARFESEALAAAKLNHPNIVHIYSLGAEGDVRFIAMEYVQGTNLREYLKKRGIPELPLALAIMRQAGLAVGAAGQTGLTHRDIKPENLLLTRKGQVKVADFGLAQLPECDRLHLTSPGMALGTPMYMSPEQVEGKVVDHRSDLYSLGVTFYHMLAGEPPFQAGTAVALALKHIHEAAPSLADKRPDLPKGLVSLVAKLMAKEPSRRYSTAAEMLRDLARVKESVQSAILGAAETLAEMPTPSKPNLEVHEATTSSPTKETSTGWRPPRAITVAAGVIALGAGAGLGWIARGEDVLAENAQVATDSPALWMANWNTIPKMPTAEAQYRYAQTRSSLQDREAAWLAVPGRFPKDTERSFSSYVQLARFYLRRGDGDRLGALGRAIHEREERRKENNEAPRERWLELGKVIQAGRVAIGGDASEVASMFKDARNFAVMDPALAELTLEVAETASKGLGDSTSPPMQALRLQLLGPLRLMPVLLETTPPPSG